MPQDKDMSRPSNKWAFVGLAVTVVLVFWCLSPWAGSRYAGAGAVAVLFTTVLYAFSRIQTEARREASDEFARATAGLRQRFEGLESQLGLLKNEWEKRFKLFESLSADVTRLETSCNESLAAEREARGAAIEDALKGETAGRMEALENTLAEVQASLKETRLDAVRTALDETSKRVGEILATTNELGDTLRTEKREREDAIEEALETEGDLRAKAIQTATSELLEALEAERQERVATFERAVKSFGAAVAGNGRRGEEPAEVAVPPEEEFEPIRGGDRETPEEAELRDVEPEAEVERGEEPVPVGGPEEAAAEETKAVPKPKGRKGRNRAKG